MARKVYYLVLGSKEFLTKPFDRVESEILAQEAVLEAKLNKLEAFYLTASEYQKLTGRSAAADYHKELNC